MTPLPDEPTAAPPSSSGSEPPSAPDPEPPPSFRWEARIEEYAGRHFWHVAVPDEPAAQRVLPLLIEPGQTYLDAWAASNHPLDRYRTGRAAMQALLEGQNRYSQEFRCYNRYKRIQWIREDAEIEREGPRTWRARGTCYDVTDRARVEGAFTESESHFRDLFEQAADMMIIVNLDGRLVDVNRWACVGLGYERRELLSLPATEIDGHLDVRELAEVWARLERGPIIGVERWYRRKDGVMVPVEVNLRAFNDASDHFVLATVRDISERKQMERLKAETARLEGILQTVRTLEHEINDPLQALVGSLELQRRSEEPSDDATGKRYARMAAAIDRIGAVMKSLRQVIRERQVKTVDSPVGVRLDLPPVSGPGP